MAVIRAILRAQLLSMRLGASRGAAIGIIAGIVWYGFWTVIAIAMASLAAAAELADLRTALPLAFLAIAAYWQLVPVISASMGSGLDMHKLLAYPVPHGRLFAVELLLRLVTAGEMLLVLAGGTIGLLANPEAGGWHGLPRIAAAMLLFIAFNVLLASGLRSLLERLLSRKRVREVVAVVVAMLWVLPRLLMAMGVQAKSLGRFGLAMQAFGLPWTASARASLGESFALAAASLCGWCAIAAGFGKRQFERSLRYDAVAAQATGSGPAPRPESWTERFYRLPSLALRDPLAGIVEKELRSLARTPRFRMVFVMGFTFSLAVWFPMMVRRAPGQSGSGPAYFLPVVSVYALSLLGQVSYLNCFGFDRSAAAFYFAAPQPIRQVLIGKNLAALFYITLEVLILVAVTTALRLGGGWGRSIETFVVMLVCSLYLLSMGNISSVHYPRGINPERVSQGGGSRSFNLVFLLFPLALIPVSLAYVARYAFESETAFTIVLAIAAAIGGVVYWIAMDSAVETATARREQIVQELSKGDGPVAAG